MAVVELIAAVILELIKNLPADEKAKTLTQLEVQLANMQADLLEESKFGTTSLPK